MNKRDRHHQRFVEYLKFFQGQLVTTWPVLTEVTLHVSVGKAVEIIALWGATIILSGITTIILAGGEESKAA